MLFTFPSRYLFTFGRQVVFSLRRWSSQIRTGFHVSRATRVCVRRRACSFAYGALTLYGRPFQTVLLETRFFDFSTGMGTHQSTPHNPMMTKRPRHTSSQFRLIRVRSPLLTESLFYFIFLQVLRCFSSLSWLHAPMNSVHVPWALPKGVSPFGHPRIEACVQLPEAFRSLPRPSSPPGAKASTVSP